jgi:hypothetical protein
LAYDTALVHVHLSVLYLATLPVTMNEWVTVNNELEGM